MAVPKLMLSSLVDYHALSIFRYVTGSRIKTWTSNNVNKYLQDTDEKVCFVKVVLAGFVKKSHQNPPSGREVISENILMSHRLLL